MEIAGRSIRTVGAGLKAGARLHQFLSIEADRKRPQARMTASWPGPAHLP